MATKFLLFIFLVLVGCNNSDNTLNNNEKPTIADSTLRTHTLYFRDSGSSSIILKRDTINGFSEIEEISRSQSFHFIRFLDYTKDGGAWVRHALINELNVQHSQDAPSNYREGKIILKATIPNINPIQDTCNLYRIDWENNIIANEVYYRDEFIETVLYRESKNPLKKLFGYSTGKDLIEFSSELYGLQNPIGYDRRYIGYLEKPDLTNNKSFDTIPDLYGVLTYANPILNTSQVLLLKIKQGNLVDLWRYKYFEGLSLEGVNENAEDKSFQMKRSDFQQWKYSNFKRFHIVLRFKGPKSIIVRVPILNDTVDTINLSSDVFNFQLRE